MDNKEEAEKLSFNVDLYKQALYQLEFLKVIENTPELKNIDTLKRAVLRYERFWLPLAAEHPDECLVAPLDIEWVWHCHMLSPVAYERDCETIVSITINHTLHSQESFTKKQSISREYWIQKYGDEAEEFILDYSSISNGHVEALQYDSKLTYDIIAAASRQAAFYYQVSLPHYRNKKFLDHSVLRYKQFIYMKTKVEQDFLVPCYDIDIIWHSHQLNPIVYKEDMVRIIGYLFNHDDNVNERTIDSKLEKAGKETSENWSTFYNARFWLPGAMYRGKPPQGRLHNTDAPSDLNINFDKEYASIKKTCTISLDKLTLTLQPSDSNRYRSIRLTGTICQGYLIVQKWLSIERRATFSSETATSLEMTDVAHNNLDTDSADNLRFELFGQVGHVCCKSECFLGSGILKFIPIINQRQLAESGGSIEGTITLGDNISLDVEGRFWNLKFDHKQDIKLLLCKTVDLGIEIGQYKTEVIPEDPQQLLGPIPLESRPETVSNICQTATHRFKSTLSGETIPLEVRFFHSQSLLMSVIQVVCSNKIEVLAHLVASDQLPLPTQVSKENGLTLNPKQGERAIFVKNNKGDWGIVKGYWKGFKRGVAGRNSARAVIGSPGKLKTNVYKFSSGNLEHYNYKRFIEGFDYSGNIRLNTTNKEMAEHIALVFAVSLLNVLCVPRPEGYKDGEKIGPKGE